MAIVKKYQAEVVSVINPIEGVYTVEFRSLDKPFKYDPGQFLHLALDKDYDGIGQWPASRCFSLQSNPDEATIRITYAVKGDFTKQMRKELEVGSRVWLKLPYGDLFTQPHNKESTVFIAGGTGITPFLSLFNHKTFTEYHKPKIYLGFRSKVFNIYTNELNRVNNSSIVVKTFYEDQDGRINIKQIISENSFESHYFISGPPTMIRSFKQMFLEYGIKEGQVLTDDWE